MKRSLIALIAAIAPPLDTMVILGQRWAEEYMKKNPGTQVQVTGGGSGTGHRRAHQRHDRHRELLAPDQGRREGEQVRERYNATGVEIAVAQDGVAFYVHEANPVQQLTIEQLESHLPGRRHQLEGRGRPRRAHRRLLARELLRHLRVLQGQRARRARTSRRAPRPCPAPPRW